MTMDGDAVGSFEDWELLVNSDSDLINSPISMANSSRLTHPISVANSSRRFEEIMADTESMFRLDYSKTRFQRRNSSDQWSITSPGFRQIGRVGPTVDGYKRGFAPPEVDAFVLPMILDIFDSKYSFYMRVLRWGRKLMEAEGSIKACLGFQQFGRVGPTVDG
ncbi:hypothetical protein DKX38_026074 [Salix brachista]|uniref:Uncharacterized protein n=1 Tax=Salix brachista TaxID=2182728 RepID=A0A5N5JWL7_9ROSI|nr:hypothetical protein DKX38_026074 [Salix brachista]